MVMAVPSHGYRAVFRELWPQLTDGTLVVSAVKGIEVDSGMTMTEIMTEENKGSKRSISRAQRTELRRRGGRLPADRGTAAA